MYYFSLLVQWIPTFLVRHLSYVTAITVVMLGTRTESYNLLTF